MKNNKFIPSAYQQLIFDEAINGVNNIIIQACSGAGKTSTIVNLINHINKNKKLLYIAFNKDIVNELKNRIGTLNNVDIMTYHSLGFSILKEKLSINLDSINEYKYKSYIKQNINNIVDFSEKKLTKVKYATYINNINSLIDYARYNLCQSPNEIYNISKKYDIPVIDDECDVVSNVLKWGSENTSIIDYTDMIWLPNELNLYSRYYSYDWVLIDESQDTSIAQQNLFLRCLKRGSRFISVGDTYQSINQWCGASEDAMDELSKLPHTKVFYLPITYRCPKKIVKLAQKYSSNIKANDDAIDGEINYNVNMFSPKSGDMVLCRTTAPLIKLYMSYLRVNKKSFIRGKDIGKNLISLIQETKQNNLSSNLNSDGVFPRLYEKLFQLRNRIMQENNIELKDAILSYNVMNLYDAIAALNTLSENLINANELIDKINDIFIDSDGDGVCLSTIHKAKGLEADNVFILCKSLMPSILAKKKWEFKTEDNLIYVAITRAKKTLNYISEKDFPPTDGYLNIDIMLKTLDTIENKINKIIKIDYSEYENKNTIDIDATKKTSHINKEKINKPIVKKANLKFNKFI